MGYEIRTIEYHEQEKADCAKENIRRIEQQLDPMDCALSTWSDNTMVHFNSFAIEALKLGAEHGIDGPAGHFWRLMDGDREVTAKLVEGRYGLIWILAETEQLKFGRNVIPHGANSRIQKQLGLREVQVVKPASRTVKASCSGLGSPVWFELEEAPAKLKLPKPIKKAV